MDKRRLALIRMIAGGITISFSPVLIRLIEIPPTAGAFYRMSVGGLILFVACLVRGYSFRCSRRVALALLAGGLMFAADLGFWHRCILYVGPGLGALLSNCQVIVLAIIGVAFLGERATASKLIAIPGAIFGLALVVGFDWSLFSSQYRWGLILGLLTAVTYAAYILFLRAARMASPSTPAARDLALVTLASGFFLGISCLIEGASLAIPSLEQGGLIATYTISIQIIGWLLISSAVNQVPASLVGLILLLQPALAFVWDIVFFDRGVNVREAVGALLVLAAIYLGSRSASESGDEPGDESGDESGDEPANEPGQ